MRIQRGRKEEKRGTEEEEQKGRKWRNRGDGREGDGMCYGRFGAR